MVNVVMTAIVILPLGVAAPTYAQDAQPSVYEVLEARKLLRQAKEIAVAIPPPGRKDQRPGRKDTVLEKIADAQIEAGDFEGAREAFTAREDKGYRDLYFQQSLVKGQLGAGDISGVLQTTTIIETANVKVLALKAIAKAQATAGDLAAAQQTLLQAREIAANIENPRMRENALALIGVRQARSGDLQKARQIASIIQDNHEKFSVLCEIAKAQAASGDWTSAQQTFQDAFHIASHTEGDLRRAYSFQNILEAQLAVGDFKGALETSAQFEGGVWKSHVFKEIAKAQADAGDISGAKQTTAAIEGAEHKALALRAIASAQVASGDVRGAISWAIQQSSPLEISYALLGGARAC